MLDSELRCCKKCGQEQPLSRFPRAKDCYARQAKKKYQADPKARAAQAARSINLSIERRSRGQAKVDITVDELTALILSASAENLVMACQLCNRAKGA
ncbi:hypothetical protein [Deinococcus fonticola]|uniref:hypothetical protein n=1 Tax=Deinococcus fonticola TaxID=2528713 RepID=UPI0010750AD0|nr:hypothetical protein [Deinococcus fonticola]